MIHCQRGIKITAVFYGSVEGGTGRGLESRGEMMATEEEKQVVVRGDIALTWRLG